MSTERLQNMLHTIADEVHPVPLEEAAWAQARRAVARRTALIAAAVTVLLVAGVAGAVNVWGGGGEALPGPAASQSSAVPSPSASASVPESVPDGAEPTEYDGTYYYLEDFGDGARVLRWVPGSEPEVVVTGDTTMLISANISPDGKYLSWFGSDSELMLLDLASGSQRKLMDYAPGDICREPIWSVTSYQLLVASPKERLGVYDITTDTFTPLGFDVDYCHPRPAETPGKGTGVEMHVTYLDLAEETVVEVDSDGETVAETPIQVPGRKVTKMIGGGADGEYYCFQTAEADGPIGDAARGNTCDTLGEPGDPGRVTRHPGAGNLLQFCDGMARKDVDGVKLLTVDAFDENLKSGEYLPEDPSLDKAWLLAFTPAE